MLYKKRKENIILMYFFQMKRHMPRKLDERIYMEERIFEFIRKYL